MDEDAVGDVTPKISQVLDDWMSLSKAEQALFGATISEIQRVSDVMAYSMEDLSTNFQSMSDHAQTQSDHLRQVLELSTTIDVDGEKVSIVQLKTLLENTILDMIQKTLMLKASGSEICSYFEELEQIIDRLSEDAKTPDLEAMRALIEQGRNQSLKMSKTDISENLTTQSWLRKVIETLVLQYANLLDKAKETSDNISDDIAKMITGMQFQDRTSQEIETIVSTITDMMHLNAQLSAESEPLLQYSEQVDQKSQDMIQNALAKMRLNSVRERYEYCIDHGKPMDINRHEFKIDWSQPDADSDNVELF